ncbi:MAG: phosphate ABC transporter permease subunit PstC [Candidatus Macondimonas sp.]
MNQLILISVLLLLSLAAYQMGRRRAFRLVDGQLRDLHSLPVYYGLYAAMWCVLPALLVLIAWTAFDGAVIGHLVVAQLPESLHGGDAGRINLLLNDIRNVRMGLVPPESADSAVVSAAQHWDRLQGMAYAALAVVVLVLAVLGAAFTLTRIHPQQRARNAVERLVMVLMMVAASVAILTTLGIVLSVVFESILFFRLVPVTEFLFGTSWSPQMAMRADQVGSSGAFGAVPIFVGTALISAIAMVVAVPIGLLSAIYLSEYAAPAFRSVAKPLLEVLAGIPTVVYGVFAVLVVAPAIRSWGMSLGLDVASESALAAGLVMGVMIIPFVSSLSDDVINAVPQSLRDGAYALGATPSETIRKVVLPAALPGIVGSIMLAISRAIGETMIVVMAAGLSANLSFNPLESVTTVTVQIVTLLTGDQEFDSPKTLAAFALGLVLFLVTLGLNVIALRVVNKYREQYE